MSLKYDEYINLIGESINNFNLPDIPQKLQESMLYSLKLGGKRLRPILLLATYNIFHNNIKDALPFAMAIEMIHTYSLIHDDLPAMDNDDMRRGKPSNHIVFGEDIAILAGDALLNCAYETMINHTLNTKNKVGCIKAMAEISTAAGSKGMIAGQVVDVSSTKLINNKEEVLNYIHSNKTGALIKASIVAGMHLAGANEKQIEMISIYANNIGLAFQIIDDILDTEGNEEILGKHTGKDEFENKLTYVSVFGLNKSKQKAVELTNEAIDIMKNHFDNNGFFVELANILLNRVQ